MESSPVIRRAIKAIGVDDEPVIMESLSAGCLHDVRRIKFENGLSVVCKCSFDADGAQRLGSEKVGLEFLASLNVPDLQIPDVLGLHVDSMGVVLVTDWVETGPVASDGWSRFGQSLARMHSIDVGDQYGFQESNHIGSTIQNNDWTDDWIQFNRDSRLVPQQSLAIQAGHLGSEEVGKIDRVIDRLGDWIPVRPDASPLHGDLWAGNVLHSNGGQVAIIDPACSIGDGWADIAMLDLFGGVHHECFEAYASAVDSDLHDMRPRVDIYQLYHVLNHVNLFGGGYLPQLANLLDRILRR